MRLLPVHPYTAADRTGFATQAPGLNDTLSAKGMTARHQAWAEQTQAAEALWDTLIGFDHHSRRALFAYCAALTVNGVQETWNRSPGRLAHADRLAEALALDMAEVGWALTTENYLGRVTKARILQAVREAKGGAAAQLIDHLKKTDMASEAERLLAGVWDHSTFSKNRDRLLEGAVAARFLSAILAQPRVKRLLSSDHFSVDGTLVRREPQ